MAAMDKTTRTSVPESGSVPPVPESVSSGEEAEAPDEDEPEGETEAPDVSHLPAEHRNTIRRLYRRVEQAVSTIERLRAENERLRRRVEELEEQPAFPDAETVLTLDDDPEAVKERISRFIDAIDTYLGAADADAPDAPDADATS
jgi:predicted RNase H-like nuclease (RuvC/YqgF family)